MSRTRDKRETPAKRFRNTLYHMWQIDDAGQDGKINRIL